MSCIFLIFLCPQPVNDFSSWFLISSSLWLLNYYFSLGSWSETIFLSNLRFLETFSINHFLEAVSFLFPEVPDITVERLYSWSDFTLGLLSFSGSLLPPNRYSRLHFSSFPCGCYLLVPFSFTQTMMAFESRSGPWRHEKITGLKLLETKVLILSGNHICSISYLSSGGILGIIIF